ENALVGDAQAEELLSKGQAAVGVAVDLKDPIFAQDLRELVDRYARDEGRPARLRHDNVEHDGGAAHVPDGEYRVVITATAHLDECLIADAGLRGQPLPAG